ncbi:MAG TPA: glycosyltransferase family A protein [Allosphingosinicella sp.]|nr:glycosyltransferase family A protein [Allosphingosinicella sp.]
MFSIVIPLWNKRHLVESTVASVLAQTWRDFELVIVDDGSTDGGMAALDRFDDLRIRRIAQPNAGPGAARNAGIEAARHQWIAFLDADDLWLPGHLDELDRVRARFPGAGLIGSSCLRTDREGGYRLPGPESGRIEAVDYFERAELGAALFSASSAAIPKSSYAALGGFGGALMGQDVEYWARIALARPIAVSSRVTAIYRLGTGGIGDTVRSFCLGRELRQAGDIAPCVALLAETYPQIRCPRQRRAVDRFIDGQFQLCIRNSARIGDYRTLRALPRLYPRPSRLADRLILAIARLPPPAANAAYRPGFAFKALVRVLRRGLGRLAAPFRALGSAAADARLRRAAE